MLLNGSIFRSLLTHDAFLIGEDCTLFAVLVDCLQECVPAKGVTRLWHQATNSLRRATNSFLKSPSKTTEGLGLTPNAGASGSEWEIARRSSSVRLKEFLEIAMGERRMDMLHHQLWSDVIKTASAKHRQEKRQGQPQLQPQQLFVAEPPEALSESPGESERETEREINQLYGSMLKRRSGGEEVRGRSCGEEVRGRNGGDEDREESMGFRVQGSVLEETPNLYSSARSRLQALTKYSTNKTRNTNNSN